MAIALLVAGMIWTLAAVALVLGCKVARTQPLMYAFLDVKRSGWFYPGTYYMFVALLALAAGACFLLSFLAWRRQHRPPIEWTAAGAFPVLPATDESPGK